MSNSVDLSHHTGFERAFQRGRLTLGFIMAIESYKGSVPTLADHAKLACRAEQLGFAALWAREVPLLDPKFGDVGQVFEPFVYLGYLAAMRICLQLPGLVQLCYGLLKCLAMLAQVCWPPRSTTAKSLMP